ncbi:MAG: HAMP domain-containing histidine kinase [Azoarcus sp.]|jgi:signal transduction histidine kinase|nr:HAMP domain-containing histidine kinase [Azoarcus sp.]
MKVSGGLYWQVDQIKSAKTPANQDATRTGVLRSRSLWDATLTLSPDVLADGRTHHHEITGPNNQTLMVLERVVQSDESDENQWRLIVAANMESVEEADTRFSGLLALSLGVLFVLLMLAAIWQIHVGLAPLRRLRAALRQIRHGKAHQLSGDYPQEVQPLVDDFNQVLNRNAEIVSRSRSQAGNLAHAIKTPLAVLQQAGELARQTPETRELAQLLLEQVEIAGRQVNWHLARSRAAAAGVPGHATPLAPVLASLIQAMKVVYAERGIEINWEAPAPAVVFAGETQDLQEMLGNLLDNACKWARSRVVVEAACQSSELIIDIGDDGPGISPEVMNSALQRGVRLDESTPGSGLGLSIVTELATLYRGRLEFSSSPELGGLQVRLILPAQSAVPAQL